MSVRVSPVFIAGGEVRPERESAEHDGTWRDMRGKPASGRKARTARTGRRPGPFAAGLLLHVVLLLPLFALSAFSAPAARAERVEPVCLDLAGGAAHRYEVEVAATPGARARGLMFRHELGPRAGMLFDFGRDEVARMWMKNTFIPLDMVFVDRGGVVRGNVRNARPRSLDTISSRVPVRAVLELNGGEAERIGLAAGDRLRHPVFGTRCDN